MSELKVQHGDFVIERRFAAAPARVFGAFASLEAKQRWFAGPADWDQGERTLDFRVGGRETLSGGPKGGVMHTFDATYHDIVPDRRIIYSYFMHLGEQKISVSLTTFEFFAEGTGTYMRFTEQGAFLDAYDDNGSREEGSRGLVEQLARALGEAGSA
jgi:uncharacterized protein YndB with AHSA1/START domain